MQVTTAESYQYVEKGCVLTGKKKAILQQKHGIDDKTI